MKKAILFSILFIGLIGVFDSNAQKEKDKKSKIDPKGIDCDKISITASSTGKIKFSDPVNLSSLSLVNKTTEIVEIELPFTSIGNLTYYKTIDLTKYARNYNLLLNYELIVPGTLIDVYSISEPCSRRIIIGQK